MPRMKILNAVEQEAFESPPMFNSVQRKQYFDLPGEIHHFAANLRTPTNKICFFLNCGYFKATKQFFPSRTLRQRDVEYAGTRIGISSDEIEIDKYDKQTFLRHQHFILEFYGFFAFSQKAQMFIVEEIKAMVKSQLKPNLIFWRCVDLLICKKTQLPSYFRLADLILNAINRRRKELTTLLEHILPTDIKELLDTLFIQSSSLDGNPVDSRTAAYKLTLLKKLSQSTKPSKIKERVADLELIQGLYQRLQPVLKALELPHDGIRYYANSVIKSEIFQVARRKNEDRYLHVIAFAANQYCRLQDNLIDVLLTSLQSYQNSAQREHKEQRYARRGQRNKLVKNLMGFVDNHLLTTLNEIETITENSQLSDGEKVERIRGLIQRQDEQKLTDIRNELTTELSEDEYNSILESRSVRIQNRVSPIIKTINFQGEVGAVKLLAAIRYFKKKDGVIDKHAPLEFLKPDERAAVTRNDLFQTSLYKAFQFLHIQSAIKSGMLNLKHSYKYRPLDDYLINKKRWERDKDQLLERAGLTKFADPKKVLSDLDEILYQQYLTTNDNILDGKNDHIKFGKNGAFTLKTPKQEETESEPLQTFFPDRRYVSLPEVLNTVNRFSGFLDEFQHWQQRYHRTRPPARTFIAGIVGLGCEIGTRKLARISQLINEAELDHVVNWYFSLEGVHAANDQVVKLMDRLELPNIYRRIPGRLHTSSDGQKFEVHSDSLNANYSFKYFGKHQGVSVYTFIDERNLFWHSTVFSAAERESAYVIDGLMHNDVVKSDIHSTDTHGFSEAIFAVTYLLGFSYAPRIKNLKKQLLYIFKTRRDVDRSKWKISPSGYIDTDLIEKHWDEILRLIVTIKLKEVTASELFRRLNSYSKQHPLYQALKAFGKIIKSISILRYINKVEFRQAIQQQLNKIELAHRFTRAVSVGNPKEFIQAGKQEQEISEGCKRLIKNSIVCWNYLYLSQKLAETNDPKQKEIFLEAIRNGSVLTWLHINLLGEYDFSDEKLKDTVGIKLPKLSY